MNKLLTNWRQPQWLASSSVDNRYALIEACLIGLFSALAALLLKQGIGWLGGWRVRLANLLGAHFILPLVGFTLGYLAGWVIELLSPSAAGGGIPQVKAALARYPIILNIRVGLVKTLGTIMILGAGFTLGRRGPTVHIGAALAAQVSSWIPNAPTNRRQMIAAGAAAGLAAGFNTPIAGVLFVVEELMRDISGLTLEVAIAASFTGAVVSRILGSTDLNLPTALLDYSRRGSFDTSEIPFCLLLGILAGVLGGLFNRSIIRGMKFSRSLPISMPLRIGLAGLMSGLIVGFLPPFFRDNAGLREFLLSGELSWQTTAIILVAQFFLTILAYSSGAPGGLFAPTLVLGSALGYLVGTLEVFLNSAGSPYTFALAGMGAFFTAVVRVPITAIVIIFEMTADFNLVLPLMIVSVVSYIVAESVSSGSLYEHLLEASGIKLTEENSHNDFLSELTADDVMESRVETLSSNLTLEEVIKAMSRSHHRGFPVVDDGKLVGIVTQSDIPKDSQQQSLTPLRDIMTTQPISVCATTSLADVLYLLNRYQLSRLPVTEGSKLLGIITRSDIIKAEAQKLNYDRSVTSKSEPSYLVYQTHAPATGRGRILLPIFNSEQISGLIKIASAIARYRKYEIELLQVIAVPSYVYPAQAKVNTNSNRLLMEQMERWGKQENIPIHTQIRVATNVAEAILETITQEHINLLLMGCQKNSSDVESIFTNLGPLIQQTSCDLMLVKLGENTLAFPNNLNVLNKWLIPISGGENVKKAMAILPALSALYPSNKLLKIEVCQIYTPFQAKPSIQEFKKLTYLVRKKMDLPVKPWLISSYSVSEAIIKLVNQEKHSLVILGASNEGLLQNAVKGNIPQTIAKNANSTVIIFRSSLK